ncbi:MAG: glycine betaine/L-proline ABC transporter substrate-binding protein ProX [Halothiobacillaceae bacterium]
MRIHKTIFPLALATTLVAGPVSADSLPGAGIEVTAVKSSVAEENFQTLLVLRALEDLGYEANPIQEIEYAAGHLAIASGDATFIAAHWDPLHIDFYNNAGGDEKLVKIGRYAPGAIQGYLIDRKTAEEYDITRIDQLSDPELARLFDANGDGKADLAGCNPGWGCEAVVEHQLTEFGLRDTVTHNQGSYAAIIADTITRYEQGKPVLYYTWMPYWVSGVLVPGEDVVFLEVPYSSLPGARQGVDTELPGGENYGFEVNDQRIVANLEFARQNPAARKLFEVMQIDTNDISAQNLRMRDGEDSDAQINRHVDAWIRANQETYDRWIGTALAASQ